MKQTIKMLIGMVALVGATSVVTASVVKNSQSSAAEAPESVFATAPVTAPDVCCREVGGRCCIY